MNYPNYLFEGPATAGTTGGFRSVDGILELLPSLVAERLHHLAGRPPLEFPMFVLIHMADRIERRPTRWLLALKAAAI